jgi:hypothetical protein
MFCTAARSVLPQNVIEKDPEHEFSGEPADPKTGNDGGTEEQGIHGYRIHLFCSACNVGKG